MCVFHDNQETRVGDIPFVGRRYLHAADNETVTADQTADAHPAVAAGIQAVVAAYENDDSLEVIVAHDADKLDCLLQAVEYREQGYHNTQEWIDNSRARLKTPLREHPRRRRPDHDLTRLAEHLPPHDHELACRGIYPFHNETLGGLAIHLARLNC